MDQEGWAEQVATALSRIEEITVKSLVEEIAEGTALNLIDVRKGIECEAGYIDGALFIPLSDFVEILPEQIKDTNTKLVIYCAGGVRSAVAADQAMQLGYTQAYSLQGGFKAWQRYHAQ